MAEVAVWARPHIISQHVVADRLTLREWMQSLAFHLLNCRGANGGLSANRSKDLPALRRGRVCFCIVCHTSVNLNPAYNFGSGLRY